MPSEYHKWLARNEKPAEKRELTQAEKWKNWFYYHKWQLLLVAGAVILVLSLAESIFFGNRERPDLQMAYIGKTPLPETAVEALEQALADFTEDISGDGVVRVRIRQYILDGNVQAVTQVQMDLAAGESRFFLLEDPAQFQEQYQVLGYVDGTYGEPEVRQEPLWYRWSDCPALEKLELGTYLDPLERPADCQEVFSRLYIARRGNETGYSHAQAANSVWQKFLAEMERSEP